MLKEIYYSLLVKILLSMFGIHQMERDWERLKDIMEVFGLLLVIVSSMTYLTELNM